MKASRLTTLCFGAALLLITWSCESREVATFDGTDLGSEPIVGLPCEGCDEVFQDLPDALTWNARIAAPDEPGDALQIHGTVRDLDGNAAQGIIVYAYHTDAKGFYPKDPSTANTQGSPHGRLRGWAITDGTVLLESHRKSIREVGLSVGFTVPVLEVPTRALDDGR